MTATAMTAMTLPAGIESTTIGPLPALQVRTSACEALVALQGAHVVRWQPSGAAPVLFVSDRSLYATATPIRGGIPLCGPWFGPGRDGNRTPAHGFYRIAPWRATAAAVDADGTARLRLELGAADLAGIAAADGIGADVRWVCDIVAGRTLAVTLTTHAGVQALVVEEALHTYLAVADARRARVDGLDGTHYRDKLDGLRTKPQHGPVTFTAETDRVYDSAAATTLADVAGGRRIEVGKSGSASTVVWNPWIAKAASMADFGDDEWPRMVCIEAGNVLDRAVTIPAGASHAIATVLRVLD